MAAQAEACVFDIYKAIYDVVVRSPLMLALRMDEGLLQSSFDLVMSLLSHWSLLGVLGGAEGGAGHLDILGAGMVGHFIPITAADMGGEGLGHPL